MGDCITDAEYEQLKKENPEGYEDKDGFFILPDGSFYDPLGYYFDEEGYDKYGGYYDDYGYYVPGPGYETKYYENYDYLNDEELEIENEARQLADFFQ